MARKGRKFELAYEWLYDLDEKYKVTSPAYVYDQAADEKREVDVLVEYTDAKGFNRKMAIECRDRKHTENVMWIEQLIQKREDLGLDYIVATTTKTFTEGAIKKAKYHGVIIEQAELMSAKIVDDNIKKFFLDVFFFRFELLAFNFIMKNQSKLSFGEFLKKLNFAEQNQLISTINTDIYFSIDPNRIIDEGKIKPEDFFSSEDNSIAINSDNLFSNYAMPDYMKDVLFFEWKIKVVPFKITLPLLDSISVFDGETHSNKDYRAVYGNDEDFFRIGYLDEKLFTEISFKHREYLRFARMNLELNTVIPDSVDTSSVNQLDYIAKNLIGKFDMRKLK